MRMSDLRLVSPKNLSVLYLALNANKTKGRSSYQKKYLRTIELYSKIKIKSSNQKTEVQGQYES